MLLKKLWVWAISLGFVIKALAVVPGLPSQCPTIDKVTHESAGQPWVVKTTPAEGWEISSNPQASSLIAINIEAILKVYIAMAQFPNGIQGVFCTYILSDGNSLIIKTNKLNSRFLFSPAGSKNKNQHFMMEAEPVGMRALADRPGFSCETHASTIDYCQWNTSSPFNH